MYIDFLYVFWRILCPKTKVSARTNFDNNIVYILTILYYCIYNEKQESNAAMTVTKSEKQMYYCSARQGMMAKQ